MAQDSREPHETEQPDEATHSDEDSRSGGYSGARARADYVADQVRLVAREVTDTLLRRVPPDVVEHLNNSRKELLLAFRGLIDKELDAIDRCTQHAHDLHTPPKSTSDEEVASL